MPGMYLFLLIAFQCISSKIPYHSSCMFSTITRANKILIENRICLFHPNSKNVVLANPFRMRSTAVTVDQSNSMQSVHSNGIDEVHEVPMAVITRPIPPVLDETKVQSLMDTISVWFFCFPEHERAIDCFRLVNRQTHPKQRMLYRRLMFSG